MEGATSHAKLDFAGQRLLGIITTLAAVIAKVSYGAGAVVMPITSTLLTSARRRACVSTFN